MENTFEEVKIKQGSLIPCSIFLQEEKEALSQCFSNIKKRKVKYLNNQNYLVILTQDCDLNKPSGYYSFIEFVVARPTDKLVNILSLGRSSLKIHTRHPACGNLSIEHELSGMLLKSDWKTKLINKSKEVIQSDDKFRKLILRWRRLSYQREPFPDAINSMIRTAKLDSEESELRSILQCENVQELMVAVFPENEGHAQYYAYFSLLLFSSEDENNNILQQRFLSILAELNKVSHNVEIINVSNKQTPDHILAQGIIPDVLLFPDSVTLDDYFRFREFNLDYLSYLDESGELLKHQQNDTMNNSS